jgi:hypothetical protein
LSTSSVFVPAQPPHAFPRCAVSGVSPSLSYLLISSFPVRLDFPLGRFFLHNSRSLPCYIAGKESGKLGSLGPWGPLEQLECVYEASFQYVYACNGSINGLCKPIIARVWGPGKATWTLSHLSSFLPPRLMASCGSPSASQATKLGH